MTDTFTPRREGRDCADRIARCRNPRGDVAYVVQLSGFVESRVVGRALAITRGVRGMRQERHAAEIAAPRAAL